jgi:hypothetical protein
VVNLQYLLQKPADGLDIFYFRFSDHLDIRMGAKAAFFAATNIHYFQKMIIFVEPINKITQH